MTDVFELRLHGIAVRFDADWQLTAAVLHGAYLTHTSARFSMHVRGWRRSGDTEWLRKELHSQDQLQGWKGPPTDIDERRVQDRNIIGGTFRYVEPGQLVREWFISNGRHSANASLLFPDHTPHASLEPYERMVDSVTFVEV